MTSADIDARDVDLAQFAPALPDDRADARARGAARRRGLQGLAVGRATEAAGALDAGRVPVDRAGVALRVGRKTLALSDVDAQLAGNGARHRQRRAGDRRRPVKLDLTLANVDLARLQRSLIATRLSGTLAGDVQKDRRSCAATCARPISRSRSPPWSTDRKVDGASACARKRAAASFAGSGTLRSRRPRAFTLTARATRSSIRRASSPCRRRSSTARSTRAGRLRRRWPSPPTSTLDKGSRFAGLDVAGNARGALDADDREGRRASTLRLGAATIKVDGGYGTATDTLAYDVDVPRLAELRPLAVRYAKARAARPRRRLAARARHRERVTRASPAIVDRRARRRAAVGRLARAATLDVTRSIAPGASTASGPLALAARPITATGRATGSRCRRVTLAHVQGDGARGTLAQARGDARGDGRRRRCRRRRFQAALGERKRPNGAVEHGVERHGATRSPIAARMPFALEAPAASWSRATDIEVGDNAPRGGRGPRRPREARWSTKAASPPRGRSPASRSAASRGSPARRCRSRRRWRSAATGRSPQRRGFPARCQRAARKRRLVRDRERDARSRRPRARHHGARGLGARSPTTRSPASARFRSARAGNADATATLAAGREPGRIDVEAPFTASVTRRPRVAAPAAAVDRHAGRDGRTRAASTSGTRHARPADPRRHARGDALRFDLPQYGVHLKDGALRARLAERVDRARRILVRRRRRASSPPKARSRAPRRERRARAAAGRVAGGGLHDREPARPAARGRRQGHARARRTGSSRSPGASTSTKGACEYEPSRVGTLSDDVVIVGQPRKVRGHRHARSAADPRPRSRARPRLPLHRRRARYAPRRPRARHDLAAGALNAKGTIRAVAGTYYVFGQRLDIDRGRLLFDGPVDNPALDVVALRKNIAVEAGVELTGTVKVPRVRLVSNPPVPDDEKLSWLLTGQGTRSRDAQRLRAARRRVGVAARPGQEADHHADREHRRPRRHLGARLGHVR